MGASITAEKRTNFYSLKAKTSEVDPTPFFGKNEKTNNGWEVTDKFNAMDGYLTKIEHSSYEHLGETKTKLKMTLNDADGTVNSLESNFNNLVYSLLNSLLGCENINFIEMNVWLGKSKVGMDGKESKRYPSIAVKNNGVEAKWFLEYAKTPKPAKVTVGKKTVTDDSEVIEFWKKKIDEINGKLSAMPVSSTPQTNNSGENKTPPNLDTNFDNDNSSLPF